MVRYLLVSEGSTDRMLLKPIEWLFEQHCKVPYAGEWANPAVFENKSRVLFDRMGEVQRFYDCEIAFVHRDTDTFSYQQRVDEITDAAIRSGYGPPVICAVPIRMTEAWFIFDDQAIRRAAGNPRSNVALNLPSHAEVQRRADPKRILEDALVTASENSGRKLRQFKGEINSRMDLVATYISDYSPLREHEAFLALENSFVNILGDNGWR